MKLRFLLGILGLLLCAYLLTGVTQIRPGERAIVYRFGRVAAVPAPGLYIGFPWGIDRIERVAVDQVRRVAVGYQPEVEEDGISTPPGQLLTGDHNLVNLEVFIEYAVAVQEGEKQVENYVLQADRADALVARAAETALIEWVGGRPVDEVLITGKAVLPGWLVGQTQQRIAGYYLGVRIQAASVAYLLPPLQVKPQFDEVTREQTRIRTRENDAQQEANQTRRNAEIERFRIEQGTAAEVNETLRLAQTDAETFAKRLAQYLRLRQQNPDILASIWWDEMGRLLVSMKQRGRIDLLDNHLGADGLDITMFAPQPGKK